MLGISSGSGISSWSKVLSGMSQPTTMGVGDFTGDKKADIVAAEPDGAGKYQYMVGTSSGSGISSWTKVQSGMRQPEVVSVGDFTGDKKADIVAVEPDWAGKYQYMPRHQLGQRTFELDQSPKRDEFGWDDGRR